MKARDQKHKIGSLFVNPGGPGGSATDFALFADYWATDGMRDRFDIVGMDPRGIGYSDNVRCFASFRAQMLAQNKQPNVAFPTTAAEDRAWTSYPKALGKACSSHGKPLSASMSTAEVARDLDVMRRAVGDKKLNYLGISYGSFLGETYANMFPDRFRTMIVDGIVDPRAWVGSKATQNRYVWDRLKSAEAGYRALIELLRRCDRAGGQRCVFAPGDPVTNFDLVAQRLKKKPLTDTDPDTGEVFRFTYADLISAVFDSLYYTDGPEIITQNMAQLIILTEPPAAKIQAAALTTALQTLRRNLDKVSTPQGAPKKAGFPHYNDDDAFYSVQCTDGVAPANADDWPTYAKVADKRIKYFGRMLASQGLPCARKTWTARDEDSYRGPFTRATASPVLITGSLWDPITSYDSAVGLANMMPNSRLLTSDNWGHAALGTSDCVSEAFDRYLISRRLPVKGARCVGDDQPFVGDVGSDAATAQSALVRAATAQKQHAGLSGRH